MSTKKEENCDEKPSSDFFLWLLSWSTTGEHLCDKRPYNALTHILLMCPIGLCAPVFLKDGGNWGWPQMDLCSKGGTVGHFSLWEMAHGACPSVREQPGLLPF